MGNSKEVKHKRIIGYVFVVLGFLSLAFGIISINAFFLFEDWFHSDLPRSFDFGIITIHNPFQWLVFIPMVNLLVATFKIIAGIGILQNKSWASKMALVIAFFWFFQFPFGTAFSFYILYFFLNENNSEQPEVIEDQPSSRQSDKL